MDEKKIKELFMQEKLKRAHPWKPVSADYLTTMEFLFLIGIDGKGKTYRETPLPLGCSGFGGQ